MPEKIVQNLCAGHSRRVPENLCKRCAGASENVLRLCEIICAGVHLHNLRAILGGGASENVRAQVSRILSPKLEFFSETKPYRQKRSQALEMIQEILLRCHMEHFMGMISI